MYTYSLKGGNKAKVCVSIKWLYSDLVSKAGGRGVLRRSESIFTYLRENKHKLTFKGGGKQRRCVNFSKCWSDCESFVMT